MKDENTTFLPLRLVCTWATGELVLIPYSVEFHVFSDATRCTTPPNTRDLVDRLQDLQIANS